MPNITPGKTVKPIDPNALSLDRIRRNFQVLMQMLSPGGVNQPLVLNPAGALSLTALGLGVNVDGVTITIVDDQLVGAPSGPSFQQVMGFISLGI